MNDETSARARQFREIGEPALTSRIDGGERDQRTFAVALPDRRARRLVRVALIGTTIAIVVMIAIEFVYGMFGPPNWRAAIGNDLAYYANLARKLFGGQGWYPDRQLHGPWVIDHGIGSEEVLYPPAAAYIFAPFMVLPFAALPAIALGVFAWLLREWRPAVWTWPLMALCFLWPLTLLKGIAGTSSLFVAIALGLGLRFRGPAVAILLKPSFLPLALIGIRSRSWWLGLGILALLSLPFLGDTLIYPKVMADSRNPDGILYSIADLPTMLIPVIAWLGRQRNPSRKRADPRVRTRAAAYDATADQ